MTKLISGPITALCLLPFAAVALEYPIGEVQESAGMEIGAVYLQPVVTEPAMGLAAAEADVHLEADIHALTDNPHGFPAGGWVPGLVIRYVLAKEGEAVAIEGVFYPMVASDGPHYGANVKLRGPGKYHLTYHIQPPLMEGGHALMRHVDKETGVSPWFAPITVAYDFVYAGVGKKGGY